MNLIGAFLVKAQGWLVILWSEVEVDAVRKNWAEGRAIIGKKMWPRGREREYVREGKKRE